MSSGWELRQELRQGSRVNSAYLKRGRAIIGSPAISFTIPRTWEKAEDKLPNKKSGNIKYLIIFLIRLYNKTVLYHIRQKFHERAHSLPSNYIYRILNQKYSDLF